MSTGFLVLESGETYMGRWRGGKNRAGEVVFNTSHSGFEEIATDPSYYSQIVLMTAPMQGNYGVDRKFWESKKYWIEGFIALEVQESARDSQWINRLREEGIPCLTDLDTRKIALRLREGGTPWGALVQADTSAEATKLAKDLIAQGKKKEKDWVWIASRKNVETVPGNNPTGPRIALLDFGSKENILRELTARCREVVVFPSRATVQEIMNVKPDGVLLSNGPGDPADVEKAPGTVRELLGRLPIFGICMGHQILGLSLGAQTYKLKFGHRGANHPIKDQLLDRVYMTSQNHGYAVDPKTLPADVQVTHTNLNDQTVAGMWSPEKQCLGIQFHPESRPGPHDSALLFDFFIQQVTARKDRPAELR